MAIALAQKIANDDRVLHGGLELCFTRDEEHRMSGIKHLDSKKLNSEYILVLDADKLGDVLVSGAGYLNGKLVVKTFLGGHSGIDIHEKKRYNSVNLISKLVAQIPQGAVVEDETGTITSINVGAIIGGAIDSAIPSLVENFSSIGNFSNYIIDNSMTNIINTEAFAIFSIRSAKQSEEQKLIQQIEKIISDFNEKYTGFAQATFETDVHLLPFERSEDNFIEIVTQKAAQKSDIKVKVGSFHAGAETHIYKNLKNANGVTFKPYLVGLANIYNMHSSDEKVEIASVVKGFGFLENIFNELNS